GRRLSEPSVPRHRLEDQTTGTGGPKRHDVHGARQHPEPRAPAEAGNEHRGEDPDGAAAKRAGRAERRTPDAARRRLRGERTRPRPRRRTAAGDGRSDGAAGGSDRDGARQQRRHRARRCGAGGRSGVYDAQRPDDHAPPGRDCRAGTGGLPETHGRRAVDSRRAGGAAAAAKPVPARGRRGRRRRRRRRSGQRGPRRRTGRGGTRRSFRELHRVRAAPRGAGTCTSEDRAHRPGLHRGHERRPDGAGHRARAAQRVARAGPTAVPSALPDRDRRRVARAAPATDANHSRRRDGQTRPAVSRHLSVVSAVVLAGAAACQKVQSAPPYSLVPVARRDIVVTATASGAIQPILTLSVKSKASGEILAMPVQTGDEVQKGQLLAKIDPRIPRNNLTQAQANVDVAQAQLENATAQLKRSETLYQSKSITEADYETAKLAYTSAKAALVTAQANLQTAKDAMEDTQVGAPITGTILELDAVLGTVISSPTNDVAGGTVILKMANLDTVQVSALVDETDVGKVRPGTAVTITVDAYPNRQFDGRVLKIEPQAQVNQNVTMFPVDVNITNPGHLLKPGMNTEVEIHT